MEKKIKDKQIENAKAIIYFEETLSAEAKQLFNKLSDRIDIFNEETDKELIKLEEKVLEEFLLTNLISFEESYPVLRILSSSRIRKDEKQIFLLLIKKALSSWEEKKLKDLKIKEGKRKIIKEDKGREKQEETFFIPQSYQKIGETPIGEVDGWSSSVFNLLDYISTNEETGERTLDPNNSVGLRIVGKSIKKLTLSSGLGEDWAKDTETKILEKLAKVAQEIYNPMTTKGEECGKLFSRIVKNEFLNALESEKAKQTLSIPESLGKPSGGEAMVARLSLEQELEKLALQTQKILRMIKDGYTQDEIGKELGISQQAISKTLKTKKVQEIQKRL